MNVRRPFLARCGIALLLVVSLAVPVCAADMPEYRLALKDHVFEPATLTVPAGQRFVLKVRNGDDTPAEFESAALGVEKIISAGREATIRLGPLEPGTYAFADEFHQDQAHGVLVVAKE